ncbi:MAG TPA: TIGR02530 family flagellar biosynthesis protein [Solirubrobacteraceae bacterium]
MSIALNHALLPPGAVGAPEGAGGVRTPASGTPSSAGSPAGPTFASVLDRASKDATSTEGLRFSKHALQRVERRGIDVSPATLERLSDGVARASGKGSRDSIVLVDGTAFVVSVPSRTVITAVGSEHMRDHVFTNIDSAVIA